MAVTVKAPPRDLRTIECDGCGYELEYRPKDVQHYLPDYDTGDVPSDAHDYIECPRASCKKRTKITPPPDDYDL